jgi:ferredoxin-like protein FixX
VQDDVSYVCDCAGVICSAVDIVDRYRLGEGTCGDLIDLCPLDVYEAASGTAVNESLCASLDCGICRLDLYIHCEEHWSRTCCYNIFDG